jgi:acetyl-CoA C-acetyltransferase
VRSVAVAAAAQTVHASRRSDVSLGELCLEAIAPAVADSGLAWEQIDAVVYGSGPDLLQGVRDAHISQLVPLIGSRRPILRVHTGGATGGSVFQAGALLVASGWARCVLLIGVEKASEPGDVQAVLNTMWNPLFEEPIGLNAINMMSLQATRQMHEHGYTLEHFAQVAVKNRVNGAQNPFAHIRRAVTVEEVLASEVIAWPIKKLEACPRSDGACALVLVDGELARSAKAPVWLLGMAESTDSMYIGDRIGDGVNDYIDAATLREAAHVAYRQAGIEQPVRDLGVAEIYAPFPCNELKAYEALGFCERGRAHVLVESGAVELDGELPVNPSGGPMCANPIGATGLVRVAECVEQIRVSAAGRQVAARTGVATSSGGSSQFYTVCVLGKERP